MPEPADNLFYESIATELEDKNKPSLHKYFYSQKFVPEDGTQPFGSILPLTDEFFGPKNLTLLILSKPYRNTEELVAAAAERIKKTYKLWSTYKVKIWIDMVLAQKMSDEGNTEYYEDMEDFAERVEAFCTELKDYGLEYMGTLSEVKTASFFQPFIDEFYKEEEKAPGFI